MKRSLTLFFAAGCAAVLAPGSLLAQTSITWGSAGLPPGLSLVTSNLPVGTVRVTGTPTKAGVYSARIYPIVNGVFGDMNEVTFRILPAGVNLPTFYGYQRGVAVKDGQFTPVGGGGRFIMGSLMGADQRVTYTTTGQTFTTPRNPPSGSLRAAATAGSLNALAIYSSSPPMSTGTSNSAYFSTNGSTFVADVLPQDFPTFSGYFYGSAFGLVSDGWSYLLVSLESQSLSLNPTPPSLRLWRGSPGMASNTTWFSLGTVNLSSSLPYYIGGNLALSAATQPNTNPVNSVSLISVANPINSGFGGLEPIALLRSTDGGTSWSNVASPSPAILSVAYDTVNRRFVGSAKDGVYTSPNGVAPWTRRSTEQVGMVLYSTFHKLIFSTANGVSSDGASWMPYDTARGGYTGSGGPFGFSMLTANSNASVVFLNGSQLSTTYVPTAWGSNGIGRVNTAFTYEMKVD